MSQVVKILQLSGILDGTRANQLRREITDIVNNGADIVLLDFQNVTFIDSSGLGVLVATLKIVRNANRQLFVCSINDQVRMVFELTKMDRIFQSFADQEEFKRQVLAAQ